MHFIYLTIYGIAVSILCLGFLYFLGLFSLPNIFFKKSNFTSCPFFCGAALFSLIGWYAIKCHIPLAELFKWLLWYVLCMAVFQFKNIKNFKLTRLEYRTFFLYLGIYIFFYCLIAAFIPIPASTNKLPIISWGNHDVFNYINHTRYLIHLGVQNIDGYSYLSGNYDQTPAVFYFFALFSALYHYDVLAAAMPLMYMCMALIAMMIVRYCRLIFQLPLWVSVAIASVVITGPFYRYIAIQYFLSTLMGTIPLLALLTDTIQFDFSNTQRGLMRLLMHFLPYWLLMFFLYSVLFISSFCLQLMVIFLFFCLFKDGFNKKIVFWTLCLLMSFLVVGLLDPAHSTLFFQQAISYMNAHVDGWGMEWISPFSILGIPGKMTTPAIFSQIFLISVFLGGISVIFWKYLHQLGNKNYVRQLILLILAVGSFLAYNVFFYYLGPAHYRPWKLATYFALPLAGVIWAGIIEFCLTRFLRTALSVNKTGYTYTIALLSLCVIYNGFHAWRYEIPFSTFSSQYRHLAQLNKLSNPSLWIKMDSYASTFLAPYFIINKKLYLLSDSYYPKAALPENILKRPLFIETTQKCDNIKAKRVVRVKNVGCLYLQD